jgi:HSP20 family protein
MSINNMVVAASFNGGGVSSLAYDANNVDEVSVTVSGGMGDSDVGGPVMNLVPRTGGNTFKGQVFWNTAGTWSRPTAMPMDAYRDGDRFVVAFDLPGVSPEAIELDVERNVLTVKAERRPVVTGQQVEMQVAERPLGVFSRQLFLGDTLDTEHIEAGYEAGVLTLRIPIAEKAKPRKIAIANADSGHQQINA